MFWEISNFLHKQLNSQSALLLPIFNVKRSGGAIRRLRYWWGKHQKWSYFHVSFYFPVKTDKDKSCQPFKEEKEIKERNPEEDADITSSRTNQAGECTHPVFLSVKWVVLYPVSRFIQLKILTSFPAVGFCRSVLLHRPSHRHTHTLGPWYISILIFPF